MKIIIAIFALFLIASSAQATVVDNYLQCTDDFVSLIPDFKQLKEHFNAELLFNIVEDLQKIDQSTLKVKEHCGLTLAEQAIGAGNLTACIADAQLIVTSAEAIIANPGNIQADIAELETIFSTLKKAEVDCDFGVKPIPAAPETPMNIPAPVPSSIVNNLAISTIAVSTIGVSSVLVSSINRIQTVEIVTIFEGVPSTIIAIPSTVPILALSSVQPVEIVTIFEGNVPSTIQAIPSTIQAIPSSLQLSSVGVLEIFTVFDEIVSTPVAAPLSTPVAAPPSSVAVSSLNAEPSTLVEDRATNNVRITIELFLGDVVPSIVSPIAAVSTVAVSTPALLSSVLLSSVFFPTIPSTIVSVTPTLAPNVTIPVANVTIANATANSTA